MLLVLASHLVALNRPVAAQAEVQTDASPPSTLPEWIWSPDDPQESERSAQAWAFERSFVVDEPLLTAELQLAVDGCFVALSVNGQTVAEVDPYGPLVQLDVLQSLVRGKNALRIEARPADGPPAVAMRLALQGASENGAHAGRQASQTPESNVTTIVTDAAWSAARLANQNKLAPGAPSASALPTAGRPTMARALGPAPAELWGVGGRPIAIEATENYEQWQQAVSGKTLTADKFWTLPGFEIALLRSALPDEGSWVSMAFDAQGRLTISKEEKGLLRLTLDRNGKSVECVSVEAIDDELRECRGLIYAHDALYANANVSKSLYKLNDLNGDGTLEEKRPLREFPGGDGHGRNDLALGPDGWIYSIHGDSVSVPGDNIVDHTSPLRDAVRHQGDQGADQGHVVATDSEGKEWKLLCAGLRNPYGLAIHPDGELFTYDADAEFDMGTPWYRPTRIVHLTAGADYGWRGVTGKWPPYFADRPDNAPPLLDIGKSSPTALAFGANADFPARYRRALFALDWTYGRVLAVHLFPRGASYRAAAETFLQGRPLNVTDIAFGPDGAMYLITGGRGTQSALYRVAYLSERSDEATGPGSSHERAAAAHADEARGIRKKLESLHASSDQDRELAWKYLDAADGTMRYAARTAIERQPLDAWRDRALTEDRRIARTEAWLALARTGKRELAAEVAKRVCSLPASDASWTEIWSALHTLSLIEGFAPDALESERTCIIALVEACAARLRSDHVQVGRSGRSEQALWLAIDLLARLEADSAAPIGSAALLLDGATQEAQLQGLVALRGVCAGWSPEMRNAYFRALRSAARFVGGEGMPKFLASIRQESLETLEAEERQAVVAELDAASVDDEPWPAPRPLVRRWTLAELLPAALDSPTKPDRDAGEVLFREALCSRCHRHGARGPAVGPDLTHVGRRFSARDVLEAIVEPSKVVAEAYRGIEVETTDGRLISGRLVLGNDFRTEKLLIAVDALQPGKVVEVDKKEVASARASFTSPMPAGLLDAFTAEEIRDLIAFLIIPDVPTQSEDQP